jgi:hypothetical protein
VKEKLEKQLVKVVSDMNKAEAINDMKTYNECVLKIQFLEAQIEALLN